MLFRDLCLTATLAMSLASSASAEISIRFSPNGGVEQELATGLAQATETIDVAIYSFSSAKLVAELKQAAARGVKVRVLLDKAPSVKERASDLESAGIDVRYVTPVMHHKFAVVDAPKTDAADADRSLVLTGSGNWTASSFSRYDEDFLRMEGEPKLAVAFTNQFNHLWRNAREFGASYFDALADLGAVEAPVVFTSANMVAVSAAAGPSFRASVKPEDGIAGRTLIAAIDAAHDSVDVATTHFRRPDLAAALTRAMERGVRVRMLLDGQEYHSNPKPGADTGYDEALAAAGADVRYKVYSLVWNAQTALQMHAKFMVVDGAQVLTGSFNWSFNSETSTMENLLTLGSEHAGLYLTEFEKVFNYGAADLAPLLERIKASGGREPCSFPPVAMRPSDVTALRHAYRSGACRAG